MTISTIISLIFGMIFIYFLLSMICNSVFEAISAARGLRSKYLTQWVVATFPGISGQLLNTPLLNGLSKNDKTTNYISSSDFLLAIMNVFPHYLQDNKIPATVQDIGKALDDFKSDNYKFNGTAELLPPDFQNLLRIYAAQAQASSEKAGEQWQAFNKSVETWFNNMMDHLTGNYKRKSMVYIWLIAAAVTISTNMDSISVVKYLISNPVALQNLDRAGDAALKDTSMAQAVAKISKDNTSETKVITSDATGVHEVTTTVKSKVNQANDYKNQLASYVPVGWQSETMPSTGQCLYILTKIMGLLMTIFAISLGAPFWYDLLGKVANLRSSLKPVVTTGDDKSNPATT